MHCVDCSLRILAHSLLHCLFEVAVELQGFDDTAPGLQSLWGVTDRRGAIPVHLGLPLRISRIGTWSGVGAAGCTVVVVGHAGSFWACTARGVLANGACRTVEVPKAVTMAVWTTI